MPCTFAGLTAEGWSAIGTISATIVALTLPIWSTKREWRRQNDLRTEDANAAKKIRADLHREVCSTVDRIVAYKDVSENLLIRINNDPSSDLEAAISRISTNIYILRSVLKELKSRPALTDGALYSCAAAEIIAEKSYQIIEERRLALEDTSLAYPGDMHFGGKLWELTDLSKTASERVEGVRKEFGLDTSKGATKIHRKYGPLVRFLASPGGGESYKFDNAGYY